MHYWRDRSRLADKCLAESAPWGDSAVEAALESATWWAGSGALPYVRSLNGTWKFKLAKKPEEVEGWAGGMGFWEEGFSDQAWDDLPGELRSGQVAERDWAGDLSASATPPTTGN